MVRVLLFGSLQDVAGWGERQLPSPPSISELKRLLAKENEALGRALSRPTVSVVLNQTMVRGDAPLPPGAEVAFLAPMSGG